MGTHMVHVSEEEWVLCCCPHAQVFLVPFNDNKPAALRRARFTDDGVLEVRTGDGLATEGRFAACMLHHAEGHG